MFLFTMFLMGGPVKEDKTTEAESGHDNRTYMDDEGRSSTLELPRLPARTQEFDDSRL